MPGGATTCLNKQDSKAKCLMYYVRCKQLTFDKALFRPIAELNRSSPQSAQ